MSTVTTDIAIVGSGIAGLTCAHFLSKKGKDIIVLESKSGSGGNIQSVVNESYLLELGPNSFLASSDGIWELIDDLNLNDEVCNSKEGAQNRFIYRDGQCQKLPTSLMEFFTTKLFSFKTKLLILSEPFRTRRGHQDDSVETFFTRRFGKELTNIVISSFISGVYAGNIALLHAKSAFPLFWNFEQKYGSMIRGAFFHMRKLKKQKTKRRKGLWSFKRGLQSLTNAIAAKLGNKILLNTSIKSLEKIDGKFHLGTNNQTIICDHVVLASPPGASSKILAAALPKASKILADIPLAPIAVVHLNTDQIEKIPTGFGMLIPRSENIETLGVLFSSKTFAERAPNGRELLTVFIGGMLNKDLINKSEDEIVEIVKKELETVLLLDRNHLQLDRVTKWKSCIPQLILHHDLKIKDLIEETETIDGLHLCGNYLTGVGLKDAVATAAEVAKRF